MGSGFGAVGGTGYCVPCNKVFVLEAGHSCPNGASAVAQAASNEVRVTDPDTGAQKGTKPEAFALIPAEALEELARVYGFGAGKYDRYGECKCASIVAALEDMLGTDVAIVMTAGSRLTTLNTPRVKGPMPETGSIKTARESVSMSATGTPAQSKSERNSPEDTDSLWSNTTPLSPVPVGFAEKTKGRAMLTTVQQRVLSGDLSVTDAILELASLKSVVKTGQPAHWPGCPALIKTETGDHNWRRGYKWSLSYSAMQRHLHRFWAGEDNDQESGLPHLAHAAWHCMTLLTFMREQKNKDDRFGRAS